MENDETQDKTLKNKPVKRESPRKMKQKKAQSTVLKQLNSQSLYPLQERIGIYVIAALSTIGLVLITYTGVMAFVTSVGNEVEAPIDIEVDTEDIYDMLDDANELLEQIEEEEEMPTQDEADLHVYLEPEDEEDVTPDDDQSEDEASSPEETNEDEPTTGTINANVVRLVRHAGGTDTITNLNEGDVVRILDAEDNRFWTQIEVEIDLGQGPYYQIGYVEPHFIDAN